MMVFMTCLPYSCFLTPLHHKSFHFSTSNIWLACYDAGAEDFYVMFSLITTAHAAEEGISVHLEPYILGHIGAMPITATLLTSWVAMVVLVIAAVVVGRRLQLVPSGAQNAFEAIIGGAYGFVRDTLESDTLARKYFPVLMTIFLFILTMNWLGLLPGVTSVGFYEGHGDAAHFVPFLYPPATDLNITLAFSIVAMFVIEFAGIAALGVWKYGGKFINFSSPLKFVVGLIELISEIGRLISFSFRLFGNIFAGKTLLVVIMFFVPMVLPVPILAYEVFVGMIQAAVFAFLTLIFIKLAVEEPH
jgi:F-type H+-transporting ATPase subunit a